jgi:tight adherence protein B
VTGALLSAALAVLLWPDGRAQRSRRAALLGSSARPRLRGLPGVDDLPVPLLAGAAAVGVAAVFSTPLVALLAGAIASAGARSWAGTRHEHTQEGLLAGLADGLGALTAELRAGRALEPATAAAVAACGDEGSGPALARAVRVPMAGADRSAPAAGREDAVASAVERISAAVRLSSRTGCSLADVLAAVHEDLRIRRSRQQELGAVIAAPRASAMLLAGLPLLGLAMGSGIGADPWHVLTATGAGQLLLVLGVAFELAGLAWSRALVRRVVR